MIIIETDKKWHKPGKWMSKLDNHFFFRFWIGFTAITYTDFDLAGLVNSIQENKIAFYVKR